MKIYVCVKQVPDTEAVIKADGSATLDLSSVKWITNPYDEFAIEEAVLLKEKNKSGEIIVLTVGSYGDEKNIRTALAMGADRAIQLDTDSVLDNQNTAKALAKMIELDGGEPSVVFTGKQAIDDDSYQVHLRLAHLIGASAVTNAITFEDKGVVIDVTREVDGSTSEVISLSKPALVAVNKGINKPRYPKLPNIMKAKKKELKKLTLADCGLDSVENKVIVTAYNTPPVKAEGKVVSGDVNDTTAQLVNYLVNESKVIG